MQHARTIATVRCQPCLGRSKGVRPLAQPAGSSRRRRLPRVCRAQPEPSSSSNTQPGPPKPASSSNKQPQRQPPTPEPPTPDGPTPPTLSPQLQRLVALLTGFGGVYGTIACLVAYFTHLDPFGNLHWDTQDVLLGLQLFAPLLVLDALLMLPDYSLEQDEAKAVLGDLTLSPVTTLLPKEPSDTAPTAPSSSSSSSSTTTSSSKLEGPAEQVPASTTTTTTSSSSSSPAVAPVTPPAAASATTSSDASDATTSGPQDPSPTPASPPTTTTTTSSSAPPPPPPLLQARLTLELLQQFYTRVNPGRSLHPAGELLVVGVASLADEMLYRAVALTLLARWVRDRLYEAGADATLPLPWGGEVDTPHGAAALGLALVATAGVAGYVGKALQERRAVERIMVVVKEGDKLVEAPEVKRRLAASIGTWNSGVAVLDGVREVLLTLSAGAAWISTGNLAAPYVGSLLTQALFSAYQRFCFDRASAKRRALLQKMQSRAGKIKAAMAAAVAAKQEASPGTPGGDAGDAGVAKATSDDASTSSSSAAAGAGLVSRHEGTEGPSSSSSSSSEGRNAPLVVDPAESSVASWDDGDIPAAAAATAAKAAAQGGAPSSSSSSTQQPQPRLEAVSLAEAVQRSMAASSSSRPPVTPTTAAAPAGESGANSSSSSSSSSVFDPSLFEDWFSKPDSSSSSSSGDGVQQPQPTTLEASHSTQLDAATTPSPVSSSSSGQAPEQAGGGTTTTTTTSSSSSSASGGALSPDHPALVALLEDMLRSPEGHAVVARLLGRGSATKESLSSGSDSSSSDAPDAAATAALIDSLLADPATKAALVAHLEQQLYDLSRKQQEQR